MGDRDEEAHCRAWGAYETEKARWLKAGCPADARPRLHLGLISGYIVERPGRRPLRISARRPRRLIAPLRPSSRRPPVAARLRRTPRTAVQKPGADPPDPGGKRRAVRRQTERRKPTPKNQSDLTPPSRPPQVGEVWEWRDSRALRLLLREPGHPWRVVEVSAQHAGLPTRGWA
jgi:hypothetical protein